MSILQRIHFSLGLLALARGPRRDPERIARQRMVRLRQLLRRTVERSQYFRNKYRGLDLDRVRLRAIPPCNKAELMEHFDQAVTDPAIRRADVEKFIDNPANLGRYLLGRYAVSHTSGSQGQPLLILQDRKSLEVLFGIMIARANAIARPGVLEGARRLISPARLAIVTMRRGFYPSGSAFEFMGKIVPRFVRVLRLSATQPDLIERLNTFRPHGIVAYASVLEALTDRADRLRLAPALRQISNTSEMLSERARNRIRQVFGVPVLDHYATGECLFLSDGCSTEPGAHVNVDWAILEVVDDNYEPVPAGQLGKKVLITNLANTVQPFIRYEVGDMLRMADGPCRCGSRFPRIERIEGRASEVFWTWNGRDYQVVPGAIFKNAADYLREVRKWQAVQETSDRIDVSLELVRGAELEREKAESVLVAKLREFGLPEKVAISVRIVPRLAADAVTGKLRRMVSRLGPPDNGNASPGR
jgi:phenylacetate-coenzyme A ligase PaaK-like adenylate-forming protein